MLSKKGFKHHLDNIEHQAQWVEYYKDMPELAEVAQKSVDMSKQILLNHFEETERLNDVEEIEIDLSAGETDIF